MRRSCLVRIGLALVVIVFLSGACLLAQTASSGGAAADYCVSKGGVVDTRVPYFNTNGDEKQWLRLNGSQQFCHFSSPSDGSRIYLPLATLYAEKPTLAALAYYAQVQYSGKCNGNPGSCYCTQLGGTDIFGGINLNGGAWVDKADPIFTTLEACIFPDLSSIDSWGLLYHSVGIIRGADLSTVLRYQQQNASPSQH